MLNTLSRMQLSRPTTRLAEHLTAFSTLSSTSLALCPCFVKPTPGMINE